MDPIREAALMIADIDAPGYSERKIRGKKRVHPGEPFPNRIYHLYHEPSAPSIDPGREYGGTCT